MMLRAVLVFVTAALLSACAGTPQLPVGVSPSAFKTPGNSYGVVMTAIPPTDTMFPGANCLLCIAAASMANNKLTDHAKTLTPAELAKLNVDVAAVLRKKGASVTMLDAFDIKTLPDAAKPAPNFAAKDFSSLKAKYKIDKLLMIAISSNGFSRPYSAYFPAGDPKASITGVAYIVDLTTNAYEWYQPLAVQKASDGVWDEPPTFPGLTNAYYQAIELTRDQLVKPLSQ